MHKPDTVYKILLLVDRSYRSSIATVSFGEQAKQISGSASSYIKMMRAGEPLVVLLLIIFVAGCKQPSESLSLEEIIERNANAIGGRKAIEAVQSMQIDLHIKDPSFEVDGTYYAARPGKMRIDVSAQGKHVFTEAFDGQNGWQWEGKGEQRLATEKAAAALRHGIELPGKLFGLHELKARGHSIKSSGREQIGGINYHVLQLVLNDGYTVSLYVDPNSWLVTRRRDVRPLHVDVDPTPTTIEQISSDFRDVNGVKFPFATAETDLTTGKLLESTVTKSVKINPTLVPAFFEKL